MWTHPPPPEPVDGFVDEYRARCLWFLKQDHYPSTTTELLSVLDQVERNGDLRAFQRAAAFRQWLSQTSKDDSVG